MIPFATPRDREIVNLSQIVKIEIHAAGKCAECNAIAEFEHLESGSEEEFKPIVHILGKPEAGTVFWTSGRSEIYRGRDFELLHTETAFSLNVYRGWQIELQRAASPIITANGNQQPLN